MNGRCRRLGQGGVSRIHVLWHGDQVVFGDNHLVSEGARSVPTDRDALLTQISPPRVTQLTAATGDQWIDDHRLACLGATQYVPRGFVAEDGGDRALGIVASVDVQIRAADAAGVDGNNNLFLSACSGVSDFGIDHLLGPEVVQRFHRSCVVLSQWNVMVRRFR